MKSFQAAKECSIRRVILDNLHNENFFLNKTPSLTKKCVSKQPDRGTLNVVGMFSLSFSVSSVEKEGTIRECLD